MSGALASCSGVDKDKIVIDFKTKTAKVEVEGSETDGKKLAAAVNAVRPSFKAEVVKN